MHLSFFMLSCRSFQSGATAGVVCDMVFFPLDTLKTRLQSQHGFNKSGGFKQLYHGFAPVMIGSAPAGIVHIKQTSLMS
jgi:solute carrier family 25 S-adenosylmethionine transporter 26